MRRGLGLVAILVGGAVVAGGIAAGDLGPAHPGTATGSARSGAWMCPHGGGDEWKGFVSLSNPGSAPVEARLTILGRRPPEQPEQVSVPPGGEVVVEVAATDAASSTYVEYFGGWIAAGWVVRAPHPIVGLGTEPCAAASDDTWYTTESSTQRGTHAWLVVMNPHAADAVFSVALFTPSTAPLRHGDLTDVVLKGRRSVAFPIQPRIRGEDAVGAEVEVKVGRVAVATLTVSEDGGVRSTLGVTGLATSWMQPTAAGAGQSILLTFVPGEEVLRFSTILRTEDPAEVSAGTLEVTQPGRSTLATPIGATGPSTIQVATTAGSLFVAALRSEGRTGDDASTGGTATPANAWVVPPTLESLPAESVLVVANPGTSDATVQLTLLPLDESFASTVTITVPAGSVGAAPAAFLGGAPRSAVLVSATAPVVALGASTSGGKDGLLLYGLALGVPVPEWALDI